MRPLLRRFSIPTLLLVLAAGCGQPVREDRAINFNKDGDTVGFQHGPNGVYVAGKDGTGLTKVFQPGPDVIATSSPLWSPDGKRMIFTTARDPKGPPAGMPTLGENPAGNLHYQRPVLATCWLHEPSGGGTPTALFEFPCDHVGYVAANLAVRWHPQDDRILYVKQVGEHRHCLLVFDLKTKQSQQMFPHSAEAILFDWAPDGEHLACVLGSKGEPENNDGIWIGRPGRDDWWHVPATQPLGQSELPSLIERLRATRPAWTRDSKRFAFVSFRPAEKGGKKGQYVVRLGRLAERKVETLAEAATPFRDLIWAPNGEQFGLVRGDTSPDLQLVRPGQGFSAPVNRRPVRQFAGWNATSERLAYIVPDRIPLTEGELWAFLFIPDPQARDAVLLTDGTGSTPGTEVFSGMRVTFPQWSPKDDRLSLWVTFMPTHRSWVSQLVGRSLRPGDPAAVLDAQTGKISWLAVNPHEKAQVGHYHLLKREYAEAWRWYSEADKEQPTGTAPTAQQFLTSLQELAGPRDSTFFHYYCLHKLGRTDEARERLDRFTRTFLPPISAEPAPKTVAGAIDQAFLQQLRDILRPDGVFAPLLRDLYAAEVFLSLDAAADGETYFRDELAAAKTEPARLSAALVLGQLLLLQGKRTEYVELAGETLAPLLLSVRAAAEAKETQRPGDNALNAQMLLDMVGTVALLPACAPEFLKPLPEESVRTLLARAQALHDRAEREFHRQQIDLVLAAAHGRLGQEKEQKEAERRIKESKTGPIQLMSTNSPAEFIESLRKLNQTQR